MPRCNPPSSGHLHVSSRSSRKEICSLSESILSSCCREWDSRLMGSAPTSSGSDVTRLWKGASTSWSFCGEKGSGQRALLGQERCWRGVWLCSKGHRAAGATARLCKAQLGSLPDPCLCEAGVALKIEQGWRESLAAHSPGLEPAVHGRGPWQGGEGRGRGVQRTPTSSSASTLLFRSFISSFISLEGPEKI